MSGLSSLLNRLLLQKPKPSPGYAHPDSRQHTGRRGEDLAADYLNRHTSLQVIHRNWSDGKQEIDIIARDGDVLVFVEVRARSASAKVPGFATLTQKKRRNLRRGAYAYLRSCHPRPQTYRYDAVELRMVGDFASRIHHFKNIDIF
jgi:putative endonuclease